MKLEVKNVKIHDDMSEETMCFSATLYVDGKRVATAKNNGHGGPNFAQFIDAKVATAVMAHIEALPPKEEPRDCPTWAKSLYPQKQTIETVIDDLVADFDQTKQLRKIAKKKTLFRIKGEEYGPSDWWTVGAPYSERVQKHLDTNYGDTVIEIYGELGPTAE